MSILNNSLLLGADAGATGYQVSRSLRFNSADSAYLSRTPASAGNRKTWTWSGWVKRSGTNRACLFSGGTTQSDTGFTSIEFESDFTLRVTGWNTLWAKSNALYRDFSAWYHVVVSFDSTQASAANQIKIYVNGSQITKATENALTQNTDYGVNQAVRHTIGAISEDANASFNNFYLADIWFLDGIATDASSFGETDATTGQWIPKTYSGSKGSNGFHLEFADNSAATAAALGKDTSGNGLNWTPNNFSVTAGAGNDSLVDTPTSYGTDAQNGGEVRGNYCTLNPLAMNNPSPTLSNGNLEIASGGAGWRNAAGTFILTSGKWYFETKPTTAGGSGQTIGVITQAFNINSNSDSSGQYIGWDANSWSIYSSNGNKINNGTSSSYGSSYGTSNTVGVALDLDNGKIWFSIDGTFQNSGNPAAGTNAAFTNLPTTGISPAAGVHGNGSNAQALNFGQRAFAYPAPSGFKALVDTNLTAPVVAKPSTVMDVALYTGNGSTQTVSGLQFNPDLVWIKNRNGANNNVLQDAVRGFGATKNLSSNQTQEEGADTDGVVTGTTSSGFTVSVNGGSGNGTNRTNYTYVGWVWDAGATTSSNGSGSITSSVRANASAGFSIVTYTGSGASATVGHGLGVEPKMIIIKNRSNAYDWNVYHVTVGYSQYLALNSTIAASTPGASRVSSTSSTTFGVGSAAAETNASGNTYVAYCFAPVAGYSSMGSYVGNGSTDGVFVFTGHQSRWLMVKRTDTTSQWSIWDTARNTYNASGTNLWADSSEAEATSSNYDVDFLSNGFKMRNTHAARNASGGTYIYISFAQNPFQYARAR